jgi:hypothetical protein
MIRKFVGAIIGAVMATGCISQPEAPSEPVKIVWKTPTLRYADMAFVRRGEEKVTLQLYAAANPLSELRVTPHNVCRNALACTSADDFNARFLAADYPGDTLYRILRGEPIFNGASLRKTRHGFTQHIEKKGAYAIRYEVSKNRSAFYDTINRIEIVVEKG